MASIRLDRLDFLFKEAKNPANGTVYDKVGYFSCRRNAAEFLNITALASMDEPIEGQETADYTRTNAIIGGTLDSQTTGASIIAVKGSRRGRAKGNKGSRTVTLFTNNPIPNTKRFHTISFRFPGWATIPGISDALGETIPVDKFADTPGNIKKVFKVNGGRKYAIMSKTAAEARTGADAPATAAEAQGLVENARQKQPKAP